MSVPSSCNPQRKLRPAASNYDIHYRINILEMHTGTGFSVSAYIKRRYLSEQLNNNANRIRSETMRSGMNVNWINLVNETKLRARA